MINIISLKKVLVNRAADIQKYDGKSLILILPGNTYSQLDTPSLDGIPVSLNGCILKIESADNENFCAVKVEQEIEFSPNVTLQTMRPNGVFYEQPEIPVPRSGFLNQSQLNSIVPNNPSISHSRAEDFMLIIT